MLGVTVRFDERLQSVAESRGVGRWSEVVVGPRWSQFPFREAMALLFHEIGHIKHRHLAKRLLSLWILLVSPRRLARLCIQQEFEADQFARAHGYGRDLARALRRFKPSQGTLHPPLAERITRLI